MKNNRIPPRLLLLGFLLPSLLSLTAGCSKSGRQKVHFVKGIVKYNGKPMVGGGSILFLPVEGGSGKEASGVIAEDGTFRLSTYGKEDGAPLGEYKVVIRQTTEKEPDGGSDDGQKPAAAAETVPKTDQIPQIYSNPVQTPLKKTVTEGGNDFLIDLSPQAAKVNNGA
jgi:hypothetical protein